MREESTQFSLEELLKLEDERVEEQKRERELAEQARLAEQAAKAREEAEAKERARRSEQDEIARREAMQKALVEQSRLEVEVRARADERERERQHELELERLRRMAPAKPAPVAIAPMAGAALFGGILMLVVVLGVHFGVTKPAADRRLAELAEGVDRAEQRAGARDLLLDEQRRVIADRDGKLAEAQRQIDALRAQLPTRTAGKKGAPEVPPEGGRGIPVRKPPSAPAQPEPSCPKGDPLCGTIPR